MEPKYTSFDKSAKTCLRKQVITEDLSWAHYQNAGERLYYQNDTQHTLSMYLDGGYETHRTDIKADYGAPSKFCLMPQGCQSHWQLGQPQQFMHLYFSDEHLKKLAVRVFDKDPRQVRLPELTFVDNPRLEALFRHQVAGLNWHTSDNHLMMEQVTDTVLVTLLQSSGFNLSVGPIKGGLAPKVAKAIKEFIYCHSHRQIYLSELAEIAQLSEYHFCRMFKCQFAMTPQEYLLQVRIEKVKQSLSHSTQSLTDIALNNGFANQSHMGRYFKKLSGMSPGEYQKHHQGR
ncbi:helix-turn-helix transcriptional regulator [Shewanella baltica]|uniref:helix-turn-helix transcriptional regulator n=1 Tax=Shewanella baltica TaxID=62322 RepID=UPI003D7B8048